MAAINGISGFEKSAMCHLMDWEIRHGFLTLPRTSVWHKVTVIDRLDGIFLARIRAKFD